MSALCSRDFGINSYLLRAAANVHNNSVLYKAIPFRSLVVKFAISRFSSEHERDRPLLVGCSIVNVVYKFPMFVRTLGFPPSW